MKLQRVALSVTLALLVIPLPAEAQPPARVPRIGLLSVAPATAVDDPGFNAFRQALREFGYVDGKTVFLELRLAGGYERLPALAADLVRAPVDIIVTDGGEPPVRAAMNATKTIPIVMAMVGDPVAAGLVASLARPGGNVTGLTLAYPELAGKRLQLLKEIVPAVTRVAVLWDQTSGSLQVGPTEAAARSLGLSLESLPVRRPADIEAAFRTATRQRAGALLQLASRLLSDHKKAIVELAARHRLPGLFELGFEDTDALACYGPRGADNFRRAAVYVDKILKGAHPRDLPVEQPGMFHLVINLRTARALGLTIPPPFWRRLPGSSSDADTATAYTGLVELHAGPARRLASARRGRSTWALAALSERSSAEMNLTEITSMRVTAFGIVIVLAIGLLGAPPSGEAQHEARVYRIGLLSPESPPPGLLQEVEQELGKLGYVQGKTFTIEVRHAGGKSHRLLPLAEQLVRRKVDAILAVNTSAVVAAKKATTSIPIVMVRVADPVKTGLVSSFARVGGNITGLTFTVEELSVKQLQLLKEVMPSISRVAVLWYAGNPGTAVIIKATEAACAQLGLRLVRLPVQGPEDLRPAGETARRDRAEALLVLDDAFITRHAEQILGLAAEHRLPVVSLYKPFAAAGGLFAYGASTAPLYRRAAHYIDKVLKGAKPADLPIEQPTEFELVVNLKTARGLGLTLPPSLLLRADQVIE